MLSPLTYFYLLMALFPNWECSENYVVIPSQATTTLINEAEDEKVWVFKDKVIYHKEKRGAMYYVFFKNTDTD